MKIDAIIDHKKAIAYKNSFADESLTDLFLPNPSSSVRIPVNTVATSLLSFFWARGFRKLRNVSSAFPYKIFGLTVGYALTYNVAKEFGHGFLRHNFGFDNIGLPHVFASALCLSLFLPVHYKMLLELPNFYFKYALHMFVFNLYWDIGMDAFKKYMLIKQPINLIR